MLLRADFSNRQKFCLIDPRLRSLLCTVCNKVLLNEGKNGGWEVEIIFVDDAMIREYNRDFRQKDSKTDVLSFPMGENGCFDVDPDTGLKVLGNIVISTETAYAQAAEYGHSPEREFAFLTAHSMLHLLGYDHEDSEESRLLMRRKEEAALEAIGLVRE
ncbi:MAG: rRNA maturation RNase YbeY [Clostridia bacterium]|nr:rRNA maturation RNase YbeY [Clostridia bacterium]